jgi:exodeoxyribonuclease V alpha subunit
MGPEGLAHYLAHHPDIKGIGPVKARRIVEAFGEEFDRVIDEDPERVAQVAKVPLAAVQALRDEWLRTRALNSSLTWLASFELTHHQMTALIERFGNAIVTVMKTDPYLLVREVPGFGFKRVDVVARKMGTVKEHPSRIRAGVVHCVAERLDQGDCWVDYEDLVELANALLAMDVPDSRERIEQALDALIEEGVLACPSIGGRFLVAQPQIHEMERDLGRTFTERRRSNHHFLGEQEDEILGRFPELNAPQRRALLAAARHNLVLISGGAGSGKTFTVAAIHRLYEDRGLDVVLAAPTGKAAKRIEQVVGSSAFTIHRRHHRPHGDPKSDGIGTLEEGPETEGSIATSPPRGVQVCNEEDRASWFCNSGAEGTGWLSRWRRGWAACVADGGCLGNEKDNLSDPSSWIFFGPFASCASGSRGPGRGARGSIARFAFAGGQ